MLIVANDFKAQIVAVKEVHEHPNADRLNCLSFHGMDWVVITSKVGIPSANDHIEGSMEMVYTPRFKPGDQVIYIPIDSILPKPLEDHLFPPGSKVVLRNSRVKTIKLRGCISQGMAINVTAGLILLYPTIGKAKLGADVTALLGIEKYEPLVSMTPAHMQAGSTKNPNAHFKKYTDIENFKNHADVFEGQDVYISEKLHGTSARYAKLPTQIKTIGQKLLKIFKLLPSHEYVFGSRNVQLQDKKGQKTFFKENVYSVIGEKLNLRQILKPGEAVYGEIVGHGIQKGFDYGCKPYEYKFFAYDVQIDGKYLDVQPFIDWCARRNISYCPPLFSGLWNRDEADKLRSGESRVGHQKIREGIVIKTSKETYNPTFGRCVLKWINDAYLLLDDNTDFH